MSITSPSNINLDWYTEVSVTQLKLGDKVIITQYTNLHSTLTLKEVTGVDWDIVANKFCISFGTGKSKYTQAVTPDTHIFVYDQDKYDLDQERTRQLMEDIEKEEEERMLSKIPIFRERVRQGIKDLQDLLDTEDMVGTQICDYYYIEKVITLSLDLHHIEYGNSN